LGGKRRNTNGTKIGPSQRMWGGPIGTSLGGGKEWRDTEREVRTRKKSVVHKMRKAGNIEVRAYHFEKGEDDG